MRIKHIIVAVIIILLLLVIPLLNIYGELLWFSSLGYEAVFLRILLTSIYLGVLFGMVFLVFALINVKTAERMSSKKKGRGGSKGRLLLGLILVFSLIIGISFSNWDVVLKFINASEFAAADPVFNTNVGFYAFVLPFYGFILNFLIATLILTTVLTFITYFFYSNIIKTKLLEEDLESSGVSTYIFDVSKLKHRVIPHLSVLLACLFFVIAFGIHLARFNVLFSGSGAVYGAGFTDLNVILPLLTTLSIVAGIIGVLFLINLKLKKSNIIRNGIIVFFVIAVIGLLVSTVVQSFVVSPDEFNMESTFIERNIENTLSAYNLHTVEEKIFPVSYNLTKADILRNTRTIKNIRLWDWRPLKETYRQLQLFRTYYSFEDIDIDRYNLNGEYKQVMISPREMNINNLQSGAKTWINEHLVYTHGYGVVMNPVDKVTSEGQPEFYIKDIPPSSDYIKMERPEIYYGLETGKYAVVKTTTEEFDYPSGEQNIYTTYNGSGGVVLSDIIRRFVYAARFGSVELLFSGSITSESRLLMHRNIVERVRKIAPFLLYDSDPYIVISDGRLCWILDAYTTTDMYPYSEPIYLMNTGKSFNYIRNSVKVVVDAYNGDVKYYVIDSADPVIQTYRKMFPEIFLDFSEMSDDLKSHLRYPEDLFRIQAEIYSLYHMKDPNVFYNKEDVWVVPDEIYRGNRQQMIPYYIIMKLPGESKEGFIMMLPFTPKGKENMIGWMAAKSDFPEYGKLTVFQFSKQELIYGPMQIEARIDQDTEISQKITLWSQSGSSVIRGNTLVIPIENSIIYIEPLYLEATERGTLPELKRVILAYGNQITMQESLDQAIDAVFGITPPSTAPAPTNQTAEQILIQISDLYNQAQQALKEGNLTRYAEYMDNIGSILKGY